VKFPPRTLYGRLSALILVLVTLVNVSYVALAFEMTRVYRQEVDQTLNHNIAANIVRDGWLNYGETVDKNSFDQAVTLISAVNPRVEIYLLDLSGNILSSSGAPQTGKRKSVSLAPIAAFLQESQTPPILGDDPRDVHERKIFSVAPIYNRTALAGYLYVVVGGQKYDSVASMLRNSYVVRLGLGTMIGGLVIVIIVGLASFNFLTRRLRRLALEVDAYKRSDDQASSSNAEANSRSDEIDEIAQTFARMSRRIDNQLHQLKLADQSRRDFVASISHDLRTPLSALQGYIETIMMKKKTLSREQSNTYLAAAFKNGEKLRNLVDNLFEFSTLDTGDWPVRRHVFSLTDLVQDVCQKFELRAREAGIRFTVNLVNGAALIQGDLRLIERLLDNLIDNALKFTSPGGSVNVSLASAQKQVIVEIRDTGIGIGEAQLTRIFEPFYSARSETEDRNGGAGLGLAIASRIAELHRTKIEVQSTPGAGTLFRFALAMVVHTERAVTAS
jgi:two-component system OmpR family sensor kinase